MSQYLLERRAKMMGITPPAEKKEQKKIPIKSVKRIVEDKLYKKIVNELLTENPNCEIKAPGCTGKAQGLHHVQKRSPKNMHNRKNLKRACNNCNLWIELNPLEAIKKGFSKSKHLKIEAEET